MEPEAILASSGKRHLFDAHTTGQNLRKTSFKSVAEVQCNHIKMLFSLINAAVIDV